MKWDVKAKILEIGNFVRIDGRYHPIGWKFDYQENLPLLDTTGPVLLFCGWTSEELQEVAKRPEEFL